MDLFIEPKDSLLQQPVKIHAQGLPTHQLYKFVLRLHHNTGTYGSYAVFKSDAGGVIDLDYDKPIRGSYSEPNGNGLFESTVPTDDVIYGGYVKCTPPEDFIYSLSVYNSKEEKILEESIRKRWKHPDVKREEIEHQEIRGTLFKPPGPGPFPAIIDVSGTGGGIHEHKSAALASRGFCVLSLAYFDYKDLPKSLNNVDLNYFGTAIDYLTSLPFTTDRVGIQGVSFGALLAMFIAAKYQQVKSCVCINGGSFLDEWIVINDDGVKLPYQEYTYDKLYLINEALVLKDVYGQEPKEELQVRFEKTSPDVSFRFVSALDDFTTATVASTNFAANKLRALGRKVEVDFVPGAHLIEPPCFPYLDVVFSKFAGTVQAYGSAIACQHGKSQTLTWERTVKYLTRTLGEPATMPLLTEKSKI